MQNNDNQLGSTAINCYICSENIDFDSVGPKLVERQYSEMMAKSKWTTISDILLHT